MCYISLIFKNFPKKTRKIVLFFVCAKNECFSRFPFPLPKGRKRQTVRLPAEKKNNSPIVSRKGEELPTKKQDKPLLITQRTSRPLSHKGQAACTFKLPRCHLKRTAPNRNRLHRFSLEKQRGFARLPRRSGCGYKSEKVRGKIADRQPKFGRFPTAKNPYCKRD